MLQGVSPQVESILAAGNHAFSNMNCQPWRFVVSGDRIEVHVDPARDRSPYNWGQRNSYFSIGAVVENMVIAASAVGYRATVSYFPPEIPTCVAVCSLSAEPGIETNALAAEILLRVTNRKKFLPVKMSDKEKQDLTNVVDSTSAVNLTFVDDRKEVKELAGIVAIDEELIFSNKSLHNFFFEHINWSKKDDDSKQAGIPLQELELSAPMKALYYVLQNWEFTSAIAPLHQEQFVAGINKSIYSTAAAMGGLIMASKEAKDYVEAGRAYERIWLAVTKVGLSMQPLNGLPFLKLYIDSPEGNEFTPQQKDIVDNAYKSAQRIFATEGKQLACIFRIGGGAVSSGHSPRRDLGQIVTIV